MLLLPFGELFSYLFDDRVSNVDRDAESLYGAAKSCQSEDRQLWLIYAGIKF